jgi:hypothetical protein
MAQTKRQRDGAKKNANTLAQTKTPPRMNCGGVEAIV